MPAPTPAASSVDDPDTASPSPDPRVAAFCDKDLLADLFDSVAQGADVWRDDPFDVASIHQEARARFGKILAGASAPTPARGGRMLLLLGESGSGKTHLMRAFRNAVHAEGRGYFGYLQMTTFIGQYSRYVLHNLIQSLDMPYHEPSSPRSGLMRLSDHLADVARGSAPDQVAELREGDLARDRLDDLVYALADEVVRDGRFGSVDADLIQALLYLQAGDPPIKARVVRYLRCEDLAARDRAMLGGIVPRTYDDAPDWMIRRLGELTWALDRAPLVLCVDQLEEVFDLEDAPTRFRRALATLCDIVSHVPSAIVVISCLSDFYTQLKSHLIRSTVDRVESDRGPLGLTAIREADEVAALIGERLRGLYESAGAPFDPARPTFPLPDSLVSQLVGLRTRDVLIRVKRYRERCIQEGKMAEYPTDPTGEGGSNPVVDTTSLEQRWNDFRATFDAILPGDEAELTGILAAAIPPCSGEVGGGAHFEAERDGRFIQAERHAADDSVRKVLIGVCNKNSQGGALGKQIEEVLKRAGGGELAAVVVRSAEFPTPGPATALAKTFGKLISGGGRRVVVEDSDWRTMMAFARFQDQHRADPDFGAWSRQTRPLTGLASLRTILGLELAESWRAGDARPSSSMTSPLYSGGIEGGSVSERPGEENPLQLPLSTGGEKDRGLTPPARTGGEKDRGLTPPARQEPSPARQEPLPASPAPILLGRTNDRRASPVTIDPTELTRHAAFLGGTGSGKTTLALNLVEQLLLAGIPAILVDRKGDLCSWAKLALGDDADVPVNGDAGDRVRLLRERVEVGLYTPGNPNGRPLSIPAVPRGLGGLSEVERDQAGRFAASALAGMMGYKESKTDLACLAILSKAVTLLGREADSPGVRGLIDFIADRDPELVDAVGLLDERNFGRLVQDLETLRLNREKLFEGEGEPLDVEALLGLGARARPGKTRLSIISTKFLGHGGDVQFWVAQLLMEVGRWISRSPSPDGSLQAVILFDEADLYLPAIGKPATKGPMENLLKRARSAGLGIFLATQSPGDFDYRCRENVRTWFLGRIKEDVALNKLKPMLSDCRGDVASRLPGQEPGEFHLVRDGDATSLKADPSALAARQLAEDEILEIARKTIPH